jgi:hypothetical protein
MGFFKYRKDLSHLIIYETFIDDLAQHFHVVYLLETCLFVSFARWFRYLLVGLWRCYVVTWLFRILRISVGTSGGSGSEDTKSKAVLEGGDYGLLMCTYCTRVSGSEGTLLLGGGVLAVDSLEGRF